MIGHALTTTELNYEELQLCKYVFWMSGTSPTNEASLYGQIQYKTTAI